MPNDAYTSPFISRDNPVQSILRKIKKGSKVRPNKKMFLFAYFFSTSANNVFLQGRLDTRLCSDAVLKFS